MRQTATGCYGPRVAAVRGNLLEKLTRETGFLTFMNECIRIEHDETAPNAAVELTILHPLPDYDLDEVEAVIPRDVDVLLASQGFHDLVDEARTILSSALRGGEVEEIQL